MTNSVRVEKILLSMTEAATLLSYSYSSIQKLVRKGTIPAVKRNRTYFITVESLTRYVNSLPTTNARI
ncbi:MAG: helix-turn-helix domain-containing protein [Phascolarctobacterium sp.]|nr:helix-turn-helix domain-containing protein [Phascolarctobacterium sp.]